MVQAKVLLWRKSWTDILRQPKVIGNLFQRIKHFVQINCIMASKTKGQKHVLGTLCPYSTCTSQLESKLLESSGWTLDHNSSNYFSVNHRQLNSNAYRRRPPMVPWIKRGYMLQRGQYIYFSPQILRYTVYLVLHHLK